MSAQKMIDYCFLGPNAEGITFAASKKLAVLSSLCAVDAVSKK